MNELRQILKETASPDFGGADNLLPLVYEELRRLAAAKMVHEPAGHTLQPTALVHEAWLRLIKSGRPVFENRAHFFAAAAEAMRRILIERARRKRALRHGGDFRRVDITEVELASPIDDDQLLALDEALDRLAAKNPLQAQIVKLRYFAGMTNEEASDALGLSPRTTKHYWAHARAWLYHAITHRS